jgi:methyl-accepting chemotaxis protein
MNWFARLPIRGKLTLVMLLISTVVLLLACAAFVAWEQVTFRDAMARDMSVLADLIGRNSTAAMQFDDEITAERTLMALSAEPHVMSACLYKGGTNRFASYRRSDVNEEFPARAGAGGHRFTPDDFRLFHLVYLNENLVGVLYLQIDLEGIRERIRLLGGIALLILLGASLLTLVLSSRLQRLISRPILDLAGVAATISARRDYSVRATKHGYDEIGQLTDAFNQMLTEIEARQSELEEAHGSLLAQTSQIMESVEVLSRSGKQIFDSSTQLAASATETASSVMQTTTTVEEVRQTAETSAQKAKSVAEASLRAVQTSQAGRKSADEAAEGMRRIRQQMESIADSMVRLSEQSQAIGQIIASVEDLAAQSNLLAVNAAIEAAKAGEQGKGFAVVAQEIRNLAEQSRQATGQVRTLLSDIQRATGAAVMATEQGTHAVEAGVKRSSEAGESLLTLAANVTEAAQASTLIAASNQQQLVGMDQVAMAMQNIKQSTVQNAGNARQLEASARHLNELGEKLKNMAERRTAREAGG